MFSGEIQATGIEQSPVDLALEQLTTGSARQALGNPIPLPKGLSGPSGLKRRRRQDSGLFEASSDAAVIG